MSWVLRRRSDLLLPCRKLDHRRYPSVTLPTTLLPGTEHVAQFVHSHHAQPGQGEGRDDQNELVCALHRNQIACRAVWNADPSGTAVRLLHRSHLAARPDGHRRGAYGARSHQRQHDEDLR